MRDAPRQLADRLHLLGLPQLTLDSPATRDVLGQRQEAGEGTAIIEQGGVVPLARDGRAVLGPVLGLPVSVHVPRFVLLEDGADGGLRLRRHDDVEGMLAEDLLLRESEHPLRGWIPAREAEVPVDQQVRKRHALDLELELSEQAVAFLQGFAVRCQHRPDGQREQDVDECEVESDDG